MVVGTSTTAASRVSRKTLIPRPNRAMPIGSPMARTDPKASSRMTTAARRPMSSAVPLSGCSTYCGSSPPTSTCTPTSRAAAPVAQRPSRSSRVRSVSSTSYWTMASRAEPSGLGCVVGSVTASTLGSSATSSTTAWMAAARSPSATPPSSAWKTSWAVAPAAAGNRCSSRSRASCDSTPGTRKSSEVEPPTRPASRPRPIRAASHSSTTRLRWVTHQRPRRCRARAMALVCQSLSNVTM